MGDMNTSFIRDNVSSRDTFCIEAMREMELVLPVNYPLIPMFHHYNGVSTYQIDYILPFKNDNLVFNANVLERNHDNTSTNDPVIGKNSYNFYNDNVQDGTDIVKLCRNNLVFNGKLN